MRRMPTTQQKRPRRAPITAELRTLPARLAEALEEASRDQKDLAAAAGLSASSVSRILQGKYPNLRAETVVRFARALSVRPGWLLVGEEPRRGQVPVIVAHGIAQDASVHELTERVAQLLDRFPGPHDERPRPRNRKNR